MRDSDVLEGMASQAGYHVAKAYDTALLALYSGASQTVNDTASDVADQDIRSAIKTLENNDVRLDQAAFFVHPTVFWDDLMGLSKYTDVYDSDPVVTGMLGGASASRTKAYKGDLYDVPIFTTTNIQEDGASSAFYNLLATPQAFMHASQTPGGNSVRSQSSYEHPQLGTLWTNDSIFGVAELRDEAVVVVKSRQSGIVS